jgi:predicted HTH transcriptional regulator
MIVHRTNEYLKGLLRELQALPKETEWAEFKMNLKNPNDIGEYISALSNSAALCGKAAGFVVWGLDNRTHDVVGTAFQPKMAKKGNEELENWLLRLLSPRIHFRFYEIQVGESPIVILEINRASGKPVQFRGRIGSYKKLLKDYPEKEREPWRIFDKIPFEDLIAAEHITDEEVLKLIDYPAYFDLLGLDLPENRTGVLDWLSKDGIIVPCVAKGLEYYELGSYTFCKRAGLFQTPQAQGC